MFVVVLEGEGRGGGGGCDGKTQLENLTTHPHNPLLTPLRYIWTDAVFQMRQILSAGFAVMYIFPKNSNGNSASKKRSF